MKLFILKMAEYVPPMGEYETVTKMKAEKCGSSMIARSME